MVALLVGATHVMLDLAFAACRGKGTGEHSLMRQIIERTTRRGLLFLFDAGFYSFALAWTIGQRQEHFLMKVNRSVKLVPLTGGVLADGSFLACITGMVDGQKQELYALMISYTTMRLLMQRAAAQARKKPVELSFLETLQAIIDAVPLLNWKEHPHSEAEMMTYLLKIIAEAEIECARRPRLNPRVVKGLFAFHAVVVANVAREQIVVHDPLHVHSPCPIGLPAFTEAWESADGECLTIVMKKKM
jgi:hypothetical protein